MKSTESDIKRIHYLVDRYFDATATDAEERELRRALTVTKCRSEKINEARAVMGYFAIGHTAPRRRLGIMPRVAAAAVAAVVCGAAATLAFRQTNADRCVAYVGHTEITDSHRILAMMHSDLAMMGKASQSLQTDVASELSTLFSSTQQ